MRAKDDKMSQTRARGNDNGSTKSDNGWQNIPDDGQENTQTRDSAQHKHTASGIVRAPWGRKSRISRPQGSKTTTTLRRPAASR